MFGKGKLTKAEQKHLREMGIDTLYKFQKQIAFLKETKEGRLSGSDKYRCYECYLIAKKLGMW